MIIKIVFYKSSSKFYDSVCINCGIFENFVQNKSSNVLTITFEDLKEHFFELTIAMIIIVGFIIYGFVKDNGIQFIFMIVGFTYGIWETNRKKTYIERNVYKQVNNKK